jgi:transcription elongation factor Elf1
MPASDCPSCGGRRVTAITIRLAPEEERTFASCRDCEWKGWYKGERTVALTDVLTLAAERRFERRGGAAARARAARARARVASFAAHLGSRHGRGIP